MTRKPLIPNFEMVDILGYGGMSTVWKARQISLDRLVAIKILAPRLATDPADVERFHAEAKSAARLKHPGIVQVYDASLSDGAYFFVMELVDGYTVGDWFRRKERLSEDEVLVLLECIANALEYAWQEFGMIHCDIKPDNVMVDADGSVKITDLGLSRTLSAMSVETTDEVMGTPEYMSPEQAMGEGVLDCRTDIYSTGAMLYHLVTGRPLFMANEADAVLTMQVKAIAPDPRTRSPTLSSSFCALLTRMLAKKVSDRYPDWKSLMEDVHRLKRKLPIRLPTMSGTSSIPMTMRKVRTRSQLTHPPPSDGTALRHRVGIWLLILVLAGWGLIAILSRNSSPSLPVGSATPVSVLPVPERNGPTVEEEREMAARRQLKRVEDWVREHPHDRRGAALRYRTLSQMYPETESERVAARRADALESDPGPDSDAILADLTQRARTLVDEGDRNAAVALLRDYRGPLAADTQADRLRLARAITVPEPTERHDLSEDPSGAVSTRHDRILRTVLARGPAAALVELESNPVLHSTDFAEDRTPDDLRKILVAAARCLDGVRDSFAAQVDGPALRVELAGGSVEGVVCEVGSAEVRLETTGGGFRTVAYAELSVRERISRLDDRDPDGLALALGLLALENHAPERARRHLNRLPAPLGARLLALSSGAHP